MSASPESDSKLQSCTLAAPTSARGAAVPCCSFVQAPVISRFGFLQDIAEGGSLAVSASASVVVITDKNVWRWHGFHLTSAFSAAGIKPLIKILPPGEHTKSRATKESIEDWMLENR